MTATHTTPEAYPSTISLFMKKEAAPWSMSRTSLGLGDLGRVAVVLIDYQVGLLPHRAVVAWAPPGWRKQVQARGVLRTAADVLNSARRAGCARGVRHAWRSTLNMFFRTKPHAAVRTDNPAEKPAAIRRRCRARIRWQKLEPAGRTR